MENMIKLSIIIALYNKEPYIIKTLESITSQTYTGWECIIVNDGSTDKSADIVRDVISKIENGFGEKFRLIDQENAGVSAARNRGIAESTGEYVCFLDADDWWASTFLEEMVGIAEEYPEAGLYASNYIYYKPGKTHVAIENIETGYLNYPKVYYEGGVMPITSISVLIRRDVFNKVGMFPVGIKLGEDFLLWSKIALNYKVVFLNKPLAYYNNDLPTSHRATRNLHNPEAHMLWHLGDLEDRIQKIENRTQNIEDWRRLLDWLRVSGLWKYWLSNEYHNIAKKELKKVDWKNQMLNVRLNYRMPIVVARIYVSFMRICSFAKQHFITMFIK